MSKTGRGILLECLEKAVAIPNQSEIAQLKTLHEMVAKRENWIMPDHYDGAKAKVRNLTGLRHEFINRELNLMDHSDDEVQAKIKLIDEQIKKHEADYQDQLETKAYLKLAMNEIRMEYTILGLSK